MKKLTENEYYLELMNSIDINFKTLDMVLDEFNILLIWDLLKVISKKAYNKYFYLKGDKKY
ncbi:hypothetical protein [Mycoplasma sp. CB776]